MADDPNQRDERKLPWPDETDPAKLGSEFSDVSHADRHRLANSFADPNSLDDARMGKAFIETNSSKKKKKPVAERARKPKSHKTLYWFLFWFALLFVVVVLAGLLPRLSTKRDLDNSAKKERDDRPVVETVTVQGARRGSPLTLPGTTIPLTEAYVYARANGYLRSRLVDIGDHVRKGQLLAVIDAPDLDAQVSQAKQQLAQAGQQLEQQKSQLALEKVTVDRYRVLVAKGVFSRQQGDQQETNYSSQLANVAAAQRNVDAFRANLERVISLQGYEQVRAPFSGVITQRNVDVGALISAGGATSGGESGPAPQGQSSTAGGSSQAGASNSGGSSGSTASLATPAESPGQGGPLFGIADNSRLRILVSVPEGYTSAIHVGAQAQLSVEEHPGAVFTGDITRTSNSIDPNTRTLLTEVQVDNRDGKLLPGMYTTVNFPPVEGAQAPLLISGDAIAIRNNQPTVATVVNGKIHMVPVTIGRDFGDAVEILTGLTAGDTLVVDVTDDVVEGKAVRAHTDKSVEKVPANESTLPGNSNSGGTKPPSESHP